MRFRFTLRDWLWLVVVIALAVVWHMDRQQLAVRLSTTERMMREQQAAFDSTVSRLESAMVMLQTKNGAAITTLQSELNILNSQRVPATIGDEPLPQPRPPKPNEQPT